MFLPSTITLKPGDSGDFVAELQRRLAAVGSYDQNAINGFYDGLTTNAVTSFQTRTGLRADGIAGPDTLRRLNGVISGDTSSAPVSNQNEEDIQPPSTSTFLQQEIVADQQAYIPPPLEAAVPTQAYAPQQAATQQSYEPAPQPVYQPPPEPLHHQQHQQAAAAGPSASDLLAQMLMQTAQTNQQVAPAHTQPQQHAPQPQHIEPQHQAYQQPQQMAAPEQPRGMMGRAMQFASEFMQKLANYFESKLPPSVLREVQAIGHSMMNHGVKEAPIPTEATARTAELPARGQEHAQQRS